MTARAVQLHGRIFLHANIQLLTGLHIGGAAGGWKSVVLISRSSAIR